MLEVRSIVTAACIGGEGSGNTYRWDMVIFQLLVVCHSLPSVYQLLDRDGRGILILPEGYQYKRNFPQAVMYAMVPIWTYS